MESVDAAPQLHMFQHVLALTLTLTGLLLTEPVETTSGTYLRPAGLDLGQSREIGPPPILAVRDRFRFS